jgi:HK97 family phage major capsid protein
MTLKQLQEQRAKLVTDMHALMQGDINTETRSAFDKMKADLEVVNGDISRVEAVEGAQAELRAMPRASRPNPGESADVEEAAEVRSARQKVAFREYLRSGKIEARDLNAASNGVAIPTAFNPQVTSAQKSYGQLYDLVEIAKTDSGEPIKYVFDDDTSNGLTAVTSGTDASETDPTLTGGTLQVDNFTTGVVKVDMALLQDAGFDIDAWVRDKFAKRYFRGSSSLIWSGNGGNVTSLKTAYTDANAFFQTATVATLAYDDFASAIGALDPAYQTEAIYTMSNGILAATIKLKDSNGRPLFIPYDNGAASGFAGTILGRPVKLVTQMDAAVATGNYAFGFGDFKQAYVFRQVNPGIGILRLNERYAAGFQVGFVGFARVGGISKRASSTLPPVVHCKVK